MLELNQLEIMTNMAKKTELPHDWAIWPPGVKQIIHFPGFPGGK